MKNKIKTLTEMDLFLDLIPLEYPEEQASRQQEIAMTSKISVKKMLETLALFREMENLHRELEQRQWFKDEPTVH